MIKLKFICLAKIETNSKIQLYSDVGWFIEFEHYLGSSCRPFSSIESIARCNAFRFSWPGNTPLFCAGPSGGPYININIQIINWLICVYFFKWFIWKRKRIIIHKFDVHKLMHGRGIGQHTVMVIHQTDFILFWIQTQTNVSLQ